MCLLLDDEGRNSVRVFLNKDADIAPFTLKPELYTSFLSTSGRLQMTPSFIPARQFVTNKSYDCSCLITDLSDNVSLYNSCRLGSFFSSN